MPWVWGCLFYTLLSCGDIVQKLLVSTGNDHSSEISKYTARLPISGLPSNWKKGYQQGPN